MATVIVQRMVRLAVLASALGAWLLLGGCGASSPAVVPDGGGATGSAGLGGSQYGGASGGGSGGSVDPAGVGGEGGSGGAAGLAGTNGSGGAGGSPDGGRPSLEAVVDHAPALGFTAPRPEFGALIVATDGARIYAVESRRDVEPGPFGLPWRSRFRLAAYDAAGAAAWTFAAAPDDVVSDVAVHPSGDVTVAVLHFPPARMAYELVRLDRDGAVRGSTTLGEPQTTPASDFGASDPRPLFRMKSELADATGAGWVRLLPDGEGLIVAFLSFVDVPTTDPRYTRFALGLEAMDWQANAYVERWARVVEGAHAADPAAWAYDELRQTEQAVRPFLARDESNGDMFVGRAWNNTRCEANVAVFAEFTPTDCVFGAVPGFENERLPLAVTGFDSAGTRLGTGILAPDADAAEQVVFALVARGGRLATAGFVVRELADGSKRTYPDPSGYVDYDGYVAIYDREGQPVFHHDFNLGRGDVLAALRWLPNDIVAVGSSGWDRWQGGQSISRGADPLIAWLAPDGSRAAARVIPMSDGSRHFNLHDLAVLDGALVGHGFSDAPMTHSGDGGNTTARTFGPLRIQLSRP